MKKIILLPILALAALSLTACGNRYLRNYQGDYLDKSSSCKVMSILDDSSAEEKIEEIKKNGYSLLGKSENVNFGGKKNQKKLDKACRKVGADLAFYADHTAFFFTKK